MTDSSLHTDSTAPDTQALRPADLSDPLYYMHNASTLIRWVRQCHDDLLLPDERQQLDRLFSLPEQPRALLFRLVMRKGEWFRSDRLNYSEIEDLNDALARLQDIGLLHLQAAIAMPDLADLCRKDELYRIAQRHLDPAPPRSQSKAHLKAILVDAMTTPLPLQHYWPDAPFDLIHLCCRDLMDRLRLMFFGNLRQDWSEFVLAELGHQQYEPVSLDNHNRAFSDRRSVDLYLRLHQLQQHLDEGMSVEPLAAMQPPEASSPWLENRRQKLLLALGRQAEREGLAELARQLYQDNRHREAKLRLLRLSEQQDTPVDTLAMAQQLLQQIHQPEARVRIQRILTRSARKAGQAIQCHTMPLPSQTLSLPSREGMRVERLVIEHLELQGDRVYHVENSLFNGLFALLFWPALFAPVPGAFFHPFQAAPADLYSPDFVPRRRALIEAGFALLDKDDHVEVILQRLRSKQGTRCSLVHWPAVQADRVEQALACIPAAHLAAIFRHLLLDLRHHRRGMPDLLCLQPARHTYRLIEVKGPKDRLQDHQRLWLEFFIEQGIPANVCHVNFHA
ncbi:VRR-NUC domain-containing protein [Marinobacterium weihaiense]|uniref:VRR-NUC domain-containing protein n=1 Tax=Marinobacterium weihaiense TaxID=2851016 RepID=A0ABS6MCI2_9GAMM|nr:VRR-NUC domain-containing protein [Marinobacterium weihaiense]MBV0933589.1 VRR-NUC domain-containing protein [Marinobacterium weihaiense]